MSRIDTRRHRHARGRSNAPRTPGADTVTLKSAKFIKKLIREHQENAKNAEIADADARRAFADANRYQQTYTDLGASEQEAVAKVQEAQAELARIQAERAEAANTAEQARKFGTQRTADRDGFASQAADAKTVLDRFEIDVPEETEPPQLPAGQPPASQADLAGPAAIDVTSEDPLTAPLSRFHSAHDEQDAEDGRTAGAA